MNRTNRALLRVISGLLVLFALQTSVCIGQSSANQPFVDKLILADTIQPVTAAQLDRALAQANSDGAQALLIQLDTPGGLDRKSVV